MASIVALTGYVFNASPNVASIVLPIEVIGEPGTVETVAVNVSNPANVDRIWIQAHRPGYTYGDGGASDRGHSYGGSSKASVRINGGPWIDIDNRTATCAFPESAYDCIGGAYATVRFTIPTDHVQQGANQVRFRYNGTDGLTSGWRVLAFNFLRSDSSAVLGSGAFAEDDPDDWVAPRPSGVEAGRDLWYGSKQLVDYPGGPTIRASCSNCHASDGSDLEYYSYSNRSIIERSKFHGLSQLQAERVASYIRSLPARRVGRPWNPPYQPGPGLDDRPADEWAAGAGLENVLERDADMLPHLFPDGIGNPAAMAERVATTETLNLREIPVALQFPDWNEWLPRVHPLDSRWTNAFDGSDVQRGFEVEIPAVLQSGARQAAEDGKLRRALKDWYDDLHDFEVDQDIKTKVKQTPSEGLVDEAMGLKQWFAVKSWEIMRNDGVEEAAPALYPGVGEARSWLSQSRTLFDVAPHIVGVNQSGTFPHGSALQNYYFSTAWYEIQTIVNAGNRDVSSVGPVDWRYHFDHIGGAGRYVGFHHPLRFYKAYVKVMQQTDMADTGVSEVPGFWGQFVSPARLLGDHSRGTEKDPWKGMSTAVRGPITEAAFRAHMDKLFRHSPSEWPRGNGQNYMPPESYEPTLGSDFGDDVYADDYYRAISLFAEMGVGQEVLADLAVWGESMWPRGDWADLVPEGPPGGPPPPPDDGPGPGDPPTITDFVLVHAPTDTDIETLDGTGFIRSWRPVNVRVDVDGDVDRVDFALDDVIVTSDDQAPYSVGGDTDGDYDTWDQASGIYLLTATPYHEGVAGTPKTIQVRIEDILKRGLRVTRFVLVDAETDTDIRVLEDGDVVDLDEGVNIRADVSRPADKVKFYLDGERVATERAAPFALGGDDDGDYGVWSVSPGEYVLSATPMLDGDEGAARTVTFKVTSTATTAAPTAGVAGLPVETALGLPTPNPSCGRAVGHYALAEAGPVRLELYDVLGRRVASLVDGDRPAGHHQVPIDLGAASDGVYVLRLQTPTYAGAQRLTAACGR